MLWWAFGHCKSLFHRYARNYGCPVRRPTIDCVTLAHPTAATVPPRITKGYLEPGSTLKLGPFVCPTSAGKIVFPETRRCPPFIRIAWNL